MTLSSTQAKEEHTSLFLRLNETFSHESPNFKALQRAARSYLPQGTVEQCKDMDALTERLQQGGFIKIGDYTVLKTMIQNAKCDVDEIIKIIEDIEQRIKRIEVQHEAVAVKPASFDNMDTNSQTIVKQMAMESNELADHSQAIQIELQDWYIKTLSRIHPIPWCEWLELELDHVFTNLDMMPGKKDQLHPRSKSDYGDFQTLSRLFNSDSSQRTVCLIEGPAGIGKSTLCRRIAYLWSKNNYSIDGRSFDLAFLLEAKLLAGDLKMCVNEQLFPKDFELSEDNIYECLRNRQKKCLLIIDGIDELTSEGKTLVMELLKGDKLRNINLLLTGRPEASREFVKYVNSHFKLNGFSFQNIKEYICKYFCSYDSNFKDKLLNRLTWDKQLENIMINPFTTLLVCSLAADNTGDIPANLNDIIDEVLHACCRKYVHKNEGSGITLLSPEKLLTAAGYLAYNGIIQEMTAYPEETLISFCPYGVSEHLLKSGILSKDFTTSRLHPKGFCYFPHKSFQEFLCAKHLAALNLVELKENLSELLQTGDKFGDKIVRFLLGMLQCQAKTKVVLENLYILVGCYDHDFWDDMRLLLDLLYYTDTSEDLLELLAQIISTSDGGIFAISYISNFQIGQMNEMNMSTKQKEDFVHRELEKRKSIPFFQKYIRKKVLTPVIEVSHLTSLGLVTYDVLPLVPIKEKNSTTHMRVNYNEWESYLPRNCELFVTGPSSLRETGLLDISWPFVNCKSTKDANDILIKGIKMSVLTIILKPGNDSDEDITDLSKSLTSTKYKVDVLFLLVEDLHDDQHVLRMLSMFSSLQNISFIKIRCDVEVTRMSEYSDAVTRKYLFDCSIIQMYYSKCCPY